MNIHISTLNDAHEEDYEADLNDINSAIGELLIKLVYRQAEAKRIERRIHWLYELRELAKLEPGLNVAG